MLSMRDLNAVTLKEIMPRAVCDYDLGEWEWQFSGFHPSPFDLAVEGYLTAQRALERHNRIVTLDSRAVAVGDVAQTIKLIDEALTEAMEAMVVSMGMSHVDGVECAAVGCPHCYS